MATNPMLNSNQKGFIENSIERRISLITKFVFLILISLMTAACVTESKTLITKPAKDLKTKAQAHSELAASYINIGKYEIAQNELEKAFNADSNHSGSYFVAGVLAMKLGLPKDAEKNFRLAAKDKKNSMAAHELGVLLCRTGRERESIQYFNKAINNPLFPNRGMSNLRAGECISKLNVRKAEEYFNAALDHNSGITVALYRLAEVYYVEDELLRARAYLERFKSASGNSPEVLYLGYQIEDKAKSIKAADEYSDQLLRQFPGSKEAKSLREQLKLRG